MCYHFKKYILALFHAYLPFLRTIKCVILYGAMCQILVGSQVRLVKWGIERNRLIHSSSTRYTYEYNVTRKHQLPFAVNSVVSGGLYLGD